VDFRVVFHRKDDGVCGAEKEHSESPVFRFERIVWAKAGFSGESRQGPRRGIGSTYCIDGDADASNEAAIMNETRL